MTREREDEGGAVMSKAVEMGKKSLENEDQDCRFRKVGNVEGEAEVKLGEAEDVLEDKDKAKGLSVVFRGAKFEPTTAERSASVKGPTNKGSDMGERRDEEPKRELLGIATKRFVGSTPFSSCVEAVAFSERPEEKKRKKRRHKRRNG
jgi:hypothetical protein